MCKEKETGEIVYVLKEEFESNRHLYKHFAEGRVLAIDLNGKYFLADVDDPRFKTGEIKNY